MVLGVIGFGLHWGTAGNPAGYNAETLDFVEETRLRPVVAGLRRDRPGSP
jgi:hypothetical protein